MQEEYKKAENKFNDAENEKYEDKESNKLKSDYLNKSYTIEERESLVDLVKFYADWLYSPVDEDLENKLYFLELKDEKNLDNYFYEKLKDEFENLNFDKKKKIETLYGLRILANKKI
jgi:hypothetical protein